MVCHRAQTKVDPLHRNSIFRPKNRSHMLDYVSMTCSISILKGCCRVPKWVLHNYKLWVAQSTVIHHSSLRRLLSCKSPSGYESMYPFIHSIRFAWSCFCSTGSLGESCCLGAQKVKKAPPTKRLKIRMIQIVTFFTADVVEEKGQPPRYKKVQNIKQNCVVLTARMPRGNPVTRATPLNQHSGNMVHTWSVGDTLIWCTISSSM